MPEKHHVPHGIKHRFPSKEISRAVNLPCRGHIDEWPVYATGRHNATTTTSVVKNRRIKVVTMNDFEASLQPKPKFLAFLESHVRKEKEYRGVSNSGISLTRLQIYRETFDYLIEAFTSYRPILASIKREYEQMLNHYSEQITLLEPLREKLYFFAKDCDQRVVEMRENERVDYYKLLKVNEDLKTEMRNRDVELEDLQYQIKKMSETISELYESLREEKDARNVLVLSKRDDQKSTTTKSEAECNRIRLENEKLKITAAEAKKAHNDAVQNLMQLHIDYADIIPRREYDKLMKDLHEKTNEMLLLTEEKKKLSSEKRDLSQLYDVAIDQRDAYYMKLKQSQIGHVPDWMTCAEFLAGSIKQFARMRRDLSYYQFVDVIQEEIILSGIEGDAFIDDDEEEKRERLLKDLKKKLGEEAVLGARLLSEMIASNLFGIGNAQERRKSVAYSSSSEFKVSKRS